VHSQGFDGTIAQLQSSSNWLALARNERLLQALPLLAKVVLASRGAKRNRTTVAGSRPREKSKLLVPAGRLAEAIADNLHCLPSKTAPHACGGDGIPVLTQIDVLNREVC
jgi:hypothetical protein